ncbi:hypothetical protein FACS1894192_12850 [Bacilli bacterium]|nr:hypothetical protein FACS1894192_12850 [Bacilli bacterium]
MMFEDEETKETVLTHEGMMRDALEHCISSFELAKELSNGKNLLINQVGLKVTEVCNEGLAALKDVPSRMTNEEWTEHLKNMGLKPRW